METAGGPKMAVAPKLNNIHPPPLFLQVAASVHHLEVILSQRKQETIFLSPLVKRCAN